MNKGLDEEGEGDEEKEYSLEIRTEDERTELVADGRDSLWLYGQIRCNDPEVDTDALTRSLSFTPGGENAGWLRLGSPEMADGFKTVRVRALPPSPEAELQPGGATVTVGTLIEGKTVSGPVQLELSPEMRIVFF